MSKPTLCPICKGSVLSLGESWFPFCSQRCKVLDLGKWLSGDYAIPVQDDEGESLISGNPDDEDSH